MRHSITPWFLAASISLLGACGGGGATNAVLGVPPPPDPGVPPPPDPQALRNVGYPLGTNLEGLKDWSRSVAFTDVFKLAREWKSNRGCCPDGATLQMDADGWVTSLEDGQYITTYIVGGQTGNYPAGRYLCLYDGDGGTNSDAFYVGGEGYIVPGSQSAGRFEIEFTPGSNVTNISYFVIYKINPANYIRNIRIIMPGFSESYATTDFFHPDFVESLQTFRILRFMDWAETNNSEVVTWADRTPPTAARYSSTRGAPIEVMVSLCNKTLSDMWYCIPHMADDDYVRRATTLIRNTLDPRLRLHLEYSNEVWNFSFLQAHWANDQGAKLWPGDPTAWVRYYGLRAAQVMDIARDVFGPTQPERLVRVISTHSGWPMLSTVILQQEISGPEDRAYQHADVFAVAPYFNVNVYPEDEAAFQTKTVDEVLDLCATAVANLNAPGGLTDQNVAIAREHGLPMVAYEGGQSCVLVWSVQNNQTIVNLCAAANRHPRMRQIYRDHLDGWTRAGGTAYMHFTLTGSYTGYGCWGLLETQNQDRSTSYKWLGIHDWLASVLR